MRIGLVTDTHLPNGIRDLGTLGPEVAAFLSTVDLILHAGDTVSPLVLDWLEQFAPVVVAKGNNDNYDDPRMKPVQILDLCGWRIGMAHSLVREDRPIKEMAHAHFRTPVDVAVGGHTHVERLELRDGSVLINSGSPNLPHHKDLRLGTVGLLELMPGRLAAEIVVLGQTPGKPNPGKPMQLRVDR